MCLLDYCSTFAERPLQIGMPADGRTETIVPMANLPNVPGGPLLDRQELAFTTERMDTIARRIRARREHTVENDDDVTSNKLRVVSYVIDKQTWQFRIHMQ